MNRYAAELEWDHQPCAAGNPATPIHTETSNTTTPNAYVIDLSPKSGREITAFQKTNISRKIKVISDMSNSLSARQLFRLGIPIDIIHQDDIILMRREGRDLNKGHRAL